MILFSFLNVLVVKGFFCNLVRHRYSFMSPFSEGDLRLFSKNEGTPRPQHQCHYHRVWPRKPLLMFPWVVAMQEGCIIVTKAATFVSFVGSLLKRGTCLWIKMYSVGREAFPHYGLRQTVLQTLLGASIGTLLKTKIGHQKALPVISFLWQNSA